MAAVVLESVCKSYPGPVCAVDNVSAQIPHGEFVVIVGPSGCGKTTTLRMIAGLEEISSGQISIGGRVVSGLAPKDRDIAMVFQNYALYPHMTVFENMAFGLRLRGTPKAEIQRRVSAVAQTLGLQEVLARKPKALSGGQRQRVAVGRAIVRQPAVFLFDEPLSNLDARMRVEMRVELKRLHQQLKTTMIYVTHDQVEAMTLADRIVIMDRGQVQQTAAPLQIYDQPANRFVASFIGSPAMNFIGGRVTSEGQRTLFTNNSLALELPGEHFGHVPSGHAVDLGIRPEAVLLSNARRSGAAAVCANVDVVESLGDEKIVHVSNKELALVAKTDSHQVCEVGDSVWLTFNTSRLHLFDGATHQSLRAAVSLQPQALPPSYLEPVLTAAL